MNLFCMTKISYRNQPPVVDKDDDCQEILGFNHQISLHENMAANCNHEDCRLLYNKMKSHYIYNTMNYTVTRYVTQQSQCSSVQFLAYFAMSFTPHPPCSLKIKSCYRTTNSLRATNRCRVHILCR